MFNYDCRAYTAGCPTDANNVVLVERRDGSRSLHYAGCFSWLAAEPWEDSSKEVVAWRLATSDEYTTQTLNSTSP